VKAVAVVVGTAPARVSWAGTAAMVAFQAAEVAVAVALSCNPVVERSRRARVATAARVAWCWSALRDLLV
jgi:hypothetical protein